MPVKLSSIPRHVPRRSQCLFVQATHGVVIRQRALADDCRADLPYEHTTQVPLCDLECLCALSSSCSPLRGARAAPCSFPGAVQTPEDRTEKGCLRWTVGEGCGKDSRGGKANGMARHRGGFPAWPTDCSPIVSRLQHLSST